MPRQARKRSHSGIYHVILRGVNKQTIFEDDSDRSRFLWTIEKYKPISCFEIYSYCLMDNHIHLLLKESGESISVTMKRISSSYVYWYNLKYDRCGHLFQERFKSEPVETKGYFMRVIRYIHQNPMKAGLASDVFECRWTSMDEYMGRAKLINKEEVLAAFSSERANAMREFVNFMLVTSEDKCLEDKGRVKVMDSAVQEELRKLGISSATELQKMNMAKRNTILSELKGLKGVSVQQISRITGVSRSVIQRV